MSKCWMVLPLLLAACVTANVFFPDQAVEQAADAVIAQIWNTPQGAK